jgi:hypothetical protein
MTHEQIFTDIYRREYWGSNAHPLYRGSSGSGSSIDFNRPYIDWLRSFLIEHKIRTVVDVGCGDFRCGPAIYNGLDIDYVGYDVYADLIAANQRDFAYHFEKRDCFVDRDLTGDLCILKDVLQHWSTAEIYDFLNSLVGRFRFIVICNCSRQKRNNKTIRAGLHRQLSADFLPLRYYLAKKVLNYETKEVSVITNPDLESDRLGTTMPDIG